MRSAISRGSSCSQERKTSQPAAMSWTVVLASLSASPRILMSQKSALAFGNAVGRASMPEAVSIKTAILRPGNAMSIRRPSGGHPPPGMGQSTRWRKPAAYSRRRSLISGPVSQPRLACMFRRTAGELAYESCPSSTHCRRRMMGNRGTDCRTMALMFSDMGVASTGVPYGKDHRDVRPWR